MKIGYGLLKFPQIADTQGYPVAEAHFQLMIGTDDEAAKQLDLAIKLAEREQKSKRGRSESSGGGYGREGGRGGRGGRQGYNHSSHGGTWHGTDAYVYPQPPMYHPAQMPAGPTGCQWPYAAPSGRGHKKNKKIWPPRASPDCERHGWSTTPVSYQGRQALLHLWYAWPLLG